MTPATKQRGTSCLSAAGAKTGSQRMTCASKVAAFAAFKMGTRHSMPSSEISTIQSLRVFQQIVCIEVLSGGRHRDCVRDEVTGHMRAAGALGENRRHAVKENEISRRSEH